MRPQVERRLSPEEIIANAEQYQREALHRYYQADYRRNRLRRGVRNCLLFMAALTGALILTIWWIR